MKRLNLYTFSRFSSRSIKFIRIAILLFTICVFVFTSGIIDNLNREYSWWNKRMVACTSNCEALGEVAFIFTPPSLSENSKTSYTYKLELMYAYLSITDKNVKANKICVDRIIVGRHFAYYIIDIPLCEENITGNSVLFDFRDLEKLPTKIEYINSNRAGDKPDPFFNTFYYPFSNFTTTEIVQFIYHYEVDGMAYPERTLYPGISLSYSEAVIWDIEVEDIERSILAQDLRGTYIVTNTSWVDGAATFLTINVAGQRNYKIVVILLFIGLLILILLSFSIIETTTFIQSIAAILFGLYSLKQVFTPQSVVNTKTIVDFGYIFLYMVVVLSIIDHAVFKLMRRKFAPFPLNDQLICTPKSVIFHKVECKFAKRIDPNRAIYFENEEEAINNGKKPCSYCFSDSAN